MAAQSKSAEDERSSAIAHDGPPPDPCDAQAPPDLDIGGHLRSIRCAFGLSQRELAKRSGVTNGSISLIEQNRVSPTIALLRKVLAGLPISLAEFFAGDVPRPPKNFFRAHELVRIRNSDLLELRQVGPIAGSGRLQMLHEHYAPGGDTGEELLTHDGEEAGVIIRGRVEITVGGDTEVLGAGDAYVFDSRIPHRFRNIGAAPAEIVSACTPPTF